MIEHLCKNCGRSFYRYSSLVTRCSKCVTSSQNIPRPTKLSKVGKRTEEWNEFRINWIKRNPGPWKCIVGGALMDKRSMTLDHAIPRSKRPDLRLDDDNINPMCGFHNAHKGSKTLEKYLASNPDKRCRKF